MKRNKASMEDTGSLVMDNQAMDSQSMDSSLGQSMGITIMGIIEDIPGVAAEGVGVIAIR